MTETAQPVQPGTDAERRRAAMARWQSRSRVIHLFRRALPLAMAALLLGLLAAVIAAAVLNRVDEAETNQDDIRLVNPRFYGRDEDGSAFVLSAREAVRDRRRAARIDLVDPVILMNSENSARATRVEAKTGVFDEESKVLALQNDVRVQDRAGGFNFRTEEAVVDTAADVVRGSRPVQGEGPTGRIAAEAYAVYDRGARITFSGNVRARLENGGSAAAAPQGEAR